MQKCEAAVIPIPDNISSQMQVLVGPLARVSNTPTVIFDSNRVRFLADLSRCLLADSRVRDLPDVVTFAYWCRQANLTRLSAKLSSNDRFLMGLGLTFHICPSNVPINFAFSLAFGLISGNTCILRLPSRQSKTLDVLVEVIAKLVHRPEHITLLDAVMLMRFERNDLVSRFWLSVADARIVWGGDETVAYIRSLPCRPRSREVAFPDRYSICVVDPIALVELDDVRLREVCLALFNDVYLMDQAACSSPQLLVWIGDEGVVNRAKQRLWPLMADVVRQRYKPEAIQIMDKYVQACLNALKNSRVTDVYRHDNMLYRLNLSRLSPDQDEYRGYSGTIHEVTLPELSLIVPVINERYQTLSYFGLNAQDVRNLIANHGLRGIDRVVPIGRALEMGAIWDGYDIVRSLSREIDIQ
jgi:hypothetical protein